MADSVLSTVIYHKFTLRAVFYCGNFFARGALLTLCHLTGHAYVPPIEPPPLHILNLLTAGQIAVLQDRHKNN